MLRDYFGTIPFAGQDLAVEAKILVLLGGLLQGIALSFSKLLLGDFAFVISWMNKKERGLWKCDGWLHHIINISLDSGCFFFKAPYVIIWQMC